VSASRAQSVTGEKVLQDRGLLLICLLSLPFLVSLLYSVVVYHQERAAKARNGPDPVEDLFLATERLELASPG
jgi:hypothetical protein